MQQPEILPAQTDMLKLMPAQSSTNPHQNSFSRLFTKASDEAKDAPIFTVASLGGKWWIFYRSDGRSGGIFDSREGALLHARLDAQSVQIALIEIVEREEVLSKDVLVRGAPAGATDKPRLKIVR